MQNMNSPSQSAATALVEEASPRSATVRWLVLLVIVAGFMFFFGLGNRGLNEPDEARYAEVPREMVESGDYISPRLDGLLFLDKPPLMYWATALSYQVFGVNEFGARFPVALCALVGVVAVFLIGRQMGGPMAGFLSGWILVTSLEYFILARTLTLDMMLQRSAERALRFGDAELEGAVKDGHVPVGRDNVDVVRLDL
jgi:4-amino-4-deoxy-L-arabinose transferase-like glycosyltransferase